MEKQTLQDLRSITLEEQILAKANLIIWNGFSSDDYDVHGDEMVEALIGECFESNLISKLI